MIPTTTMTYRLARLFAQQVDKVIGVLLVRLGDLVKELLPLLNLQR